MKDESKATGGSSISAALSEAQGIVDAAKKRASDILADANNRSEQITKDAYAKGFEQGVNEVAINAVRLLEFTDQVEESLSEKAARIALQVSSTIIGEHLKVEPETIKRLAKRALRESFGGGQATIVVNPEDRPALQSIQPELKRLTGGSEVVLEDDPLLRRGGCVVRTEFGEVDASLDSLLQAMSQRLGLSSVQYSNPAGSRRG